MDTNTIKVYIIYGRRPGAVVVLHDNGCFVQWHTLSNKKLTSVINSGLSPERFTCWIEIKIILETENGEIQYVWCRQVKNLSNVN